MPRVSQLPTTGVSPAVGMQKRASPSGAVAATRAWSSPVEPEQKGLSPVNRHPLSLGSTTGSGDERPRHRAARPAPGAGARPRSPERRRGPLRGGPATGRDAPHRRGRSTVARSRHRRVGAERPRRRRSRAPSAAWHRPPSGPPSAHDWQRAQRGRARQHGATHAYGRTPTGSGLVAGVLLAADVEVFAQHWGCAPMLRSSGENFRALLDVDRVEEMLLAGSRPPTFRVGPRGWS